MRKVTRKVTTHRCKTGAPSTARLCSNAGAMGFAETAHNLKVADVLDKAFTGTSSPWVHHTIGSTMTALAVSLIAGADDASDINLLAPLVTAGLITEHPSDSTIHRRHAQLADLGAGEMCQRYAAAMKTVRTTAWEQ